MDENEETTAPPAPRTPATSEPAPEAPIHERMLDLAALLILITMATGVFMLAGPEAFTAVTSVGLGLFAAWRGRPPRP
ncbi:hypothetical protein GCM10010425_40940 [Streptomyces spororaveus]|uniref:Uncharacterized protein n=1 Tax=Streptomyces spororaveus TaxID=284039 RepID=A0ABQ3TEB7_9ACTN|nr:hypothetical protein [Streptomyces spororaveus]WSV98358.1 hypothetical protein OG509_20465 [Streptomyces sp. NBC_01006]GHI78768.1 hypothetical protein Sspor_43290 [Streptomyces spororaveus]